jgi:hypothetical protein
VADEDVGGGVPEGDVGRDGQVSGRLNVPAPEDPLTYPFPVEREPLALAATVTARFDETFARLLTRSIRTWKVSAAVLICATEKVIL